ncbi:MAG: YjgN family protein [Gammaproteobacteria bacterium]
MLINMNNKATPFEFSGRGGEYFRIWIVNILLTLITLGIYSAWATVRKRCYFYGNTRLANTEFRYLATPWMILKGRLIAVAVLLIYLGLGQFSPVAAGLATILLILAAPWMVWKSMDFKTRMSQFRKVRFNFSGKLRPVIFYLLIMPVVPLLVFAAVGAVLYFSLRVDPKLLAPLGGLGLVGVFLAIPLVQARLAGYYVNQVAYGQGKFAAAITSGTYYGTYIKAFLIIILVLIVIGYAGFLALGKEFFSAMQPQQALAGGSPEIPGLVFLFFILFGVWLRAYVGVRIRNYIFDSTNLDRGLQLHSAMRVMGLFGVYLANTVLLIITLGLAHPWNAVRVARYKANSTFALIEGNLSKYVTQQQEYQSALGDELGDALDIDMDIAL